MTMLITTGGPEAVVAELIMPVLMVVLVVLEAEAEALYLLVVVVEVDIEEEFLLANKGELVMHLEVVLEAEAPAVVVEVLPTNME